MSFFSFLRKGFVRTSVVVLLTIQVVNVCIDPHDNFLGAHDMAVNEVESCIEFVLEVVLDQTDAVKETDEHDNTTTKHSSMTLLFCVAPNRILSGSPAHPFSTKSIVHPADRISSVLLPVISPPPKSA